MFGPSNDSTALQMPMTNSAEAQHVFKTFQKLTELRLVRSGNSFTIFNPLKAAPKTACSGANNQTAALSSPVHSEWSTQGILGKSDFLSLSVRPNGIDQGNSSELADKREEELEREQFQFAKTANIYLKMRLASSRHISIAVLAKLAREKDWRVRALVAAHAKTPFPVLALLAQDKEKEVRAWVAGNREAGEEILLKLVQDESSLVRARLAGNSNVPRIGLMNLVFDDQSSVRLAAAVNPAMSKILISILITDPDPKVRRRVARNPNVSATHLLKLIEDVDASVRLSANAKLHKFFNLLRAEKLMVASKHNLPIVNVPKDYSDHGLKGLACSPCREQFQ